jgi:hypothetical protein
VGERSSLLEQDFLLGLDPLPVDDVELNRRV